MTTAHIRVMAGALEPAEVERRLEASVDESSDWTAATERELYYPYYWFSLRFGASTLFGRTAMRVSCVVDARTRVAATTDPFRLARAKSNGSWTLEPRVIRADALEIARRYGGYVMRNRRRALVVPRVDVIEGALVFKPMSIVRLSRLGAPSFRVLVDRMSGGFHLLSEQKSVGGRRR